MTAHRGKPAWTYQHRWLRTFTPLWFSTKQVPQLNQSHWLFCTRSVLPAEALEEWWKTNKKTVLIRKQGFMETNTQWNLSFTFILLNEGGVGGCCWSELKPEIQPWCCLWPCVAAPRCDGTKHCSYWDTGRQRQSTPSFLHKLTGPVDRWHVESFLHQPLLQPPAAVCGGPQQKAGAGYAAAPTVCRETDC